MPGRPSMSTTHMRHEPNASSRSVAHSLGTAMPASAAARMTDVPAGTVRVTPSMATVTDSVEVLAGVPKSMSSAMVMGAPLEVLAEVLQGAEHRVRRQAPHRT